MDHSEPPKINSLKPNRIHLQKECFKNILNLNNSFQTVTTSRFMNFKPQNPLAT